MVGATVQLGPTGCMADRKTKASDKGPGCATFAARTGDNVEHTSSATRRFSRNSGSYLSTDIFVILKLTFRWQMERKGWEGYIIRQPAARVSPDGPSEPPSSSSDRPGGRGAVEAAEALAWGEQWKYKTTDLLLCHWRDDDLERRQGRGQGAGVGAKTQIAAETGAGEGAEVGAGAEAGMGEGEHRLPTTAGRRPREQARRACAQSAGTMGEGMGTDVHNRRTAINWSRRYWRRRWNSL